MNTTYDQVHFLVVVGLLYLLINACEIIDSTSGCKILSFLDTYSGYHQIAMKESDQLATSFITPYGSYCYVTMSFGLKNAGATYQWCMQQSSPTKSTRSTSLTKSSSQNQQSLSMLMT